MREQLDLYQIMLLKAFCEVEIPQQRMQTSCPESKENSCKREKYSDHGRNALPPPFLSAVQRPLNLSI